jgi:GT2 family glycosyltransferase
MAFTIVIPSRSKENLEQCVHALRDAGEAAQVVVVDDGIDGSQVDAPYLRAGWGLLVPGVKPFCFARNVNIGIQAASPNDVLILNDDALLDSPLGFSVLAWLSGQHPEIGVLASSTNVTGYPLQMPRNRATTTRLAPFVAFVAVYIRRAVLRAVGPLDERFGGPGVYGGEDVDYCLRLREAGLEVAVSDMCHVDHSRLHSTFRAVHPSNRAPGDITESNRLGREKWGDKWPHR